VARRGRCGGPGGAAAYLHARGRDRVRWLALPPRAAVALLAAGDSSLVLDLAILSAFERTSIALALIGFHTYPVLVAGAAVALGEALGPVQVAGGVLVLAGAALLQRGGEDAEPHEAASGAA
jgi:drug/metabolite transporter (DMT)-like permease